MICDLFRKQKVISFGGCISQIFFSHAVGGTEMVLLIAMAFDRYVAICRPLHYLTIMSPRMCLLILMAAWIIGLIHSSAQLAFIINLPFCGPNVLDSFYCDIPRLLKLIFILFSVWKHSSGGSSKALSTLSAHITVVFLFFGPTLFVYTWPHPDSQIDKFLALFDAVFTPFLNPVIYTFRNKEMKAAIKRIFKTLLTFRNIS
ncbi:Olfactory receptor 4F3/4F16/4F29 [Lemmus lemmus]